MQKAKNISMAAGNAGPKLLGLTLAAVFSGELLVMLWLESWGAGLSTAARILLDSLLLSLFVLPTLYFLVFKEMSERLRISERNHFRNQELHQRLEVLVEERTEGLRRANEDLLSEVQERARVGMALSKALAETRSQRDQMQAFINAVDFGLMVVDYEWRIRLANRAFDSIFKCSAYDLYGRSLHDFLAEWTGGALAIDNAFLLSSGKQVVLLSPAGQQSAKTRPVEMQAGRVLSWEGHQAVVLTFRQR